MQLHVVTVGPARGPLVLLLHGFPECWYGWRHQALQLAAAGWRVWVPDQRGYNLSEKPRQVSAYRLDRLAGDVLGLIDAAGEKQAAVVGHDWGGIVGWQLAATHPQRVSQAVLLCAPHPVAFWSYLRSTPEQMLRSWYAGLMQIPWLPEFLYGRGHGYLLQRAMVRTSSPGTFSAQDFAHYWQAWSQPGALRGMVNWYRAFRRFREHAEPLEVSVPVHLVWSGNDPFLSHGLAAASLKHCQQGQLVMLDGQTHWLHHENPQRVGQLILDLLTSPPVNRR